MILDDTRSGGGGSSWEGYTPVSGKCTHCGMEITGFSILCVLDGESAGTYHPGCLKIVEQAQTVAELSKKIDALTEAVSALTKRED